MEIVHLSDEQKKLYFCCLEDWSEEAVTEAGSRKQIWYEKMKERGLRVLLAKDDNGQVGGMIHYLPIEESIVDGKDL